MNTADRTDQGGCSFSRLSFCNPLSLRAAFSNRASTVSPPVKVCNPVCVARVRPLQEMLTQEKKKRKNGSHRCAQVSKRRQSSRKKTYTNRTIRNAAFSS